jgi:hypothetical protein
VIFTIVSALLSAALAAVLTWLFLRSREAALSAAVEATRADRDRAGAC